MCVNDNLQISICICFIADLTCARCFDQCIPRVDQWIKKKRVFLKKAPERTHVEVGPSPVFSQQFFWMFGCNAKIICVCLRGVRHGLNHDAAGKVDSD